MLFVYLYLSDSLTNLFLRLSIYQVALREARDQRVRLVDIGQQSGKSGNSILFEPSSYRRSFSHMFLITFLLQL